MSSEPGFFVAESTLTDRYQTTVPVSVRKALGLGKQDKIAYHVTASGTVNLTRIEEEQDPVLEKFLDFLDQEIARNPERLQPLTEDWAEGLQSLTEGVDIGDTEQLLPDDD